MTGGAGPAVGVALVDRAHRFFARPASALGFEVVGAPTVIGPKGPQTDWIARRPEREGRGITFVNVEGVQSNAEEDRWARAKIVFTLKAPEKEGSYPLVGAFFYGTEKSTALGTRVHPEFGPLPLGGEDVAEAALERRREHRGGELRAEADLLEVLDGRFWNHRRPLRDARRTGEGVEIFEDQAHLIVPGHVGRELPSAATVLEAQGLREAEDAVIHPVAHRFRVGDLGLVDVDERLQRLGRRGRSARHERS